MKVLKATQAQYEMLNGYQSGCSKLEFIQDAQGFYVVGLDVINDPAFNSIKSELLSMEEIDFNPMVEE